ncbi:poly(A) polymerase [Blastomonas natatoria]|uniref:Poly(A) polymerase n=1 Tax=Blastomonas natatoria TaxID=34015 RepID=A0A2V3V0X5_9SPHN|nr:CCA tRNA nucleotidyltransferase [Blastomonas natatoria]PXW74468.1 poly(A) polymerase [Blastomonas natatoria]
MTRIAAAWSQREDLKAMLAALDPDGGQCRYVGGAVRDALLGIEATDIDIATRLLPEEVIARLEQAGLRAVPTGLAHGTVTAVLPGGPVEITTLRRDVTTDGRHAEVAFTDDWREDAARRDFTINALFADPATLDVTDFFNGLADLEARLVRFIGDAGERILEDHLRILRYFRFHARFGGAVDADAMAACTRHAQRLKALSRERIARELLLLLGSADPLRSVRLMEQCGIWPVILPEMAQDGLDRLADLLSREQTVGAERNALLRLAALLPEDPLLSDTVAARLRLSKAQRLAMARYATPWPAGGTARQIAAQVQPEDLIAPWLLLRAPETLLQGGWQSLQGWQVPAFPLGGRDIIALGINAGPDVARALGEIRRRWIAEDFPDSARLGEIASEVVVQAG